jgi:hypothetical protein
MKKYQLVLAALLPLIFSPAAATQTLLEGIRAFIEDDHVTAARVLRPYAEKGDATAQAMLAIMLFDGAGTRANPADAARFARRSAEQGSLLGQLTLGRAYADGKGVAQDYVLAHMWFNLAAAHPDNANITAKPGPAERRSYLASRMTSAQIAEAQRLARAWRPKVEKTD